jgi:hypothetical protein
VDALSASPLRYRSLILTLQDLTAPRWVDLLAEAGLNTLLLHAMRLPEDITSLIAFRTSDAGRALALACQRAGIQLEYELHTASWLLPRAHFAAHPDWFRMDVRGVRTADSNFCLSSPGARELFTARARQLARLLPPETGRFLWFQDDVTGSACHCPDCAPYSAADQSLMYANLVLHAVRQVEPRATASFLAYQDALAAPERVAPEDGVFLEYAPIGRCRFGGTPFHITEYWLDASRHSGWRRPAGKLPVPPEIVQRDIAFYYRMGARSISSYAVMCDAEYWERYGEPPVVDYGKWLADPGSTF